FEGRFFRDGGRHGAGYRTCVLALYDTAKGEVRELSLREPGKVSIYVCGPTVYDLPHIGHGRSVLVWQVVRRYLEWCGFDVTYVSNVTDIDDNIIQRAQRDGRAAQDVARQYEDEWWRAFDAMGVDRPTFAPRATDYV